MAAAEDLLLSGRSVGQNRGAAGCRGAAARGQPRCKAMSGVLLEQQHAQKSSHR